MRDILIIGYGNPGRLDDGLGPAFAEAVEKLKINGVDVDSNYQLSIEDSYDMANHKIVIFADADSHCEESFYFRRIEPEDWTSFSSHSISPKALLGFTEKTFKAKIDAYIVGIRGYEFNEFGEQLSELALSNLNRALKFIEPILKNRNFL